MKTIIASILLIGFVIAEVDAQTGAGSFIIGGSGYIQQTKQHVGSGPPVGNNPMTTFSISPTVGYFPIRNLMTGLTAAETFSWSHQADFKFHGNNFSIGPVFRYYFPFGGKFAVFPEAAALYTRTSSKSKGELQGLPVDTNFKNEFYSYRAGAGITWFVSPNIGIEAIFSYRQNNQKSNSNYLSYTGATVGIQFYLPGRTNQLKE